LKNLLPILNQQSKWWNSLMAFKFSVGEVVEYKPRGQSAGLFSVIRHMPEEDGAGDRKYCIKSRQEGFERTVSEFELQPANLAEGAYPEPVKPHGRQGSRG
jgi:hypothetical protein